MAYTRKNKIIDKLETTVGHDRSIVSNLEAIIPSATLINPPGMLISIARKVAEGVFSLISFYHLNKAT
jgi:hypothetical protein